MKDHKISLKYNIGQTIKTSGCLYKVIGYEYIKDRGIKYIILGVDGIEPRRFYVYESELSLLELK